MVLLLFSSTGSAATYLNGSAELSYVDYNAESDGKQIVAGETFEQKYSIAWGATNLIRYSQPQYYKLLLGYDWTSFTTDLEEFGASRKLSDTYGKFRYNGEVGYQPANIPIRFRAYLADDISPSFRRDIYQGIIDDGLTYMIHNKNKNVSTGFMFVFEPERAYNPSLRGLPRLHVDYRETTGRSDESFSRAHNKTRELAVAGLNKENNWLHYRSLVYENYLDKYDNYEQQQIQIGLIDYVGRRKWSTLTNWIKVSADGQLTIRKNESHVDDLEEYDLNLHAIATRKLWEAKTFLNYNRELKNDTLREVARVPLYVKGIWGRDTSWNVSVLESRGREKRGNRDFTTSYENKVTLGMTTFTRSSFTLSPSLSLKTEKNYGSDADAYEFNAGVTTASTRLFSTVHALTAGYHINIKDDGLGTENSSSWSQTVRVKGRSRVRDAYVLEAEQVLESGNGSTYIDSSRLGGSTDFTSNYVRSVSSLAATKSSSAFLRNSVNLTLDILKVENSPVNTELYAFHNISYEHRDMAFRMDTNYRRRDTGTDAFLEQFSNTGVAEYRPDRYNDASLRYGYLSVRDENGDYTRLELTQRYNRYFYARTGVLRHIATLTEEYTRTYYSQSGYLGSPGERSVDSQSLLLSGRYSPTSRLSLYGSFKYQKDPNAITYIYTGGLSADFKLLTTNLDYSYGTRDSDKMVEKRLAASVKRSF